VKTKGAHLESRVGRRVLARLWRRATASRRRRMTMALMTTAEVATEIRMSEDWVRDHAGELGAIRAGRTRRAPLRFEPESIEAWKRAHRVAGSRENSSRRRLLSRSSAGVELLPLPSTTARR
jgi:hypothetical protein